MRVIYWGPFVLLTLILAGIGFRYGVMRQGITETDVITLYAQRYLADHAASGLEGVPRTTDCSARPGNGPWTWLVVTCGVADEHDAALFRYEVNWLGGLIRHSGPAPRLPGAPKT
jgi:hypothetical protein